ncbi:MAG: glycosyltransferase family 4 protein [Rothia dentocariosa]|jgi:methionine-R-sulfoxide reductase|uniref:Glycosyltransferase family 4 protein n=1 Tax=Rothia dentocariosa TaxID=2047 RepID=A0A930KKZ5_9MICC|nr:glycosyltransferase family 4 protein [Rothia dentocariosa]
MSKELYLATNNGDIGGGEVMLLNIARAARGLGYQVVIIGPANPPDLIEAAADEGFTRIVLPAKTRIQYMVQLRLWHRAHRDALLWCNGLVPAAATGGRAGRIVHLHQLPTGTNAKLVPFARKKALQTLVPSEYVAASVPGATVFPNWVQEVPLSLAKSTVPGVVRIGYLGRLTPSKGIGVLCQAIEFLNSTVTVPEYRLVVAGAPVFASSEEEHEVSRALENIERYTDRLGWSTPQKLFDTVDMLVVPSQAPESFGLVAAEAMSARVPVIVSDAGALPEVVGEDYPYIYPAQDPSALVEKIRHLTQAFYQESDNLNDIISAAFWRWQELYSPDSGRERVRHLLEKYL